MRARTLLIAMIAAPLGAAAFAADPPASPTASAPAAGAPVVTQDELLAQLARKDGKVVVLDVRTRGIRGRPRAGCAQRVARSARRASRRARALKDKEVVLYCRTGRRTALATETLKAAGFTNLRHLDGDYQAWAAANRPVEK